MTGVGFTSYSELIDTQWDVNKDIFIYEETEEEELIDTQWDVNTAIPAYVVPNPKN